MSALEARLARDQPPPAAPLDVERIRRDFPILSQRVYGRPLVFLDNAASAQRPRAVLEAINDCYERYYANVHRGVHALSQRSTDAFEAAREKVRRRLQAREAREIVFVRGTTEAINLVAQSWGRNNMRSGDEIVVSEMEHHSNIVPWQMLCAEKGALLKVAPVTDRGELDLDAYAALLGERTRLVATLHVSNALGTINPVREIARLAHQHGALVLIDGAQAAPHLPIDVVALGCDFYAFSGHKAFGPTGIGALYGRAELLEAMPPWQGGGEMIRKVTFTGSEYAPIPHKFEAGTPDIAGAIGLGAALDYVDNVGLEAMARHEAELLRRATAALEGIDGVRVLGTAPEKVSVVSFVVDSVHAHDVGTILDREGVAVRAGHHCAQPLLDRFGVAATTRASFAFYNTLEEVDRFAEAVRQVQELFGR
jgi:cysteine desulfurase/selenocysteine lyase